MLKCTLGYTASHKIWWDNSTKIYSVKSYAHPSHKSQD